MKHFYLILLTVLVTFKVHAQKVDLDKENFSYNYRNLPNFVLPKPYSFYSIEVIKSPDFSNFSDQRIADQIKIEDKTKVQLGADLRIILELGDFKVKQASIDHSTKVLKDKNGNEFTRNYYVVVIFYTLEGTASIKNDEGDIRSPSYIFHPDNVYKYVSSQFINENEAKEHMADIATLKNKVIPEHLQDELIRFSNYLNNIITYKSLTETRYLWKLDSKKHPEFEAFNKSLSDLKHGLESIKVSYIPEDLINNEVPKIAEYFNTIPAKYADPSEKGHIKIRHGAYYNLAALYMYTEQFDKAKEYAQKMVSNGYDTKEAQKLLLSIDKTQESLAKHGLATRHFR